VNLSVKSASVYHMIMQRCYNPKMTGYKNYGGRGITVSDEWLDDPTKFFDWYKKHYFDGGQVNRIDNNGQYSKENCQVVSAKTNGRNRRNTRFVEAFGEKKNAAEWVDDPRCFEKDWRNILRRIDRGVDPEMAMSKDYKKDRYSRAAASQHKSSPRFAAFGETKSLAEWTADPRCVVSKQTLFYRLCNTWDTEVAITTPVRKQKKNSV